MHNDAARGVTRRDLETYASRRAAREGRRGRKRARMAALRPRQVRESEGAVVGVLGDDEAVRPPAPGREVRRGREMALNG